MSAAALAKKVGLSLAQIRAAHYLDWSHVALTEVDAKTIAQLAWSGAFANLRQLSLGRNQLDVTKIGEAGVQALGAAVASGHLRLLDHLWLGGMSHVRPSDLVIVDVTTDAEAKMASCIDGVGGELAVRRAAYLQAHLAHLEAVLADAVNSAIASRPKDVVAQLAAELAVRAGLGLLAPTSAGLPAVTKGLERALEWNASMEEAAVEPIEAVIERSLEAMVCALPDNPLAYVAHQVTEMATFWPNGGKTKSNATATAYREAIFCEARRLGGHN